MTAKRRSKAVTRTPEPPVGLVTLMRALQPVGATHLFAPNHARSFQDVGPRVLDATSNRDDGDPHHDIVQAAIDRHFPGNDYGPADDSPAHTCPDHAADAAFWAGVAAAWYVMTSLYERGVR